MKKYIKKYLKNCWYVQKILIGVLILLSMHGSSLKGMSPRSLSLISSLLPKRMSVIHPFYTRFMSTSAHTSARTSVRTALDRLTRKIENHTLSPNELRLRMKPRYLNEFNSDDKTLLMNAAIHGREDLVAVLQENSALACNKKNDNQETALLLAARHGHSNAVRQLLQMDRISLSNTPGYDTPLIAVIRDIEMDNDTSMMVRSSIVLDLVLFLHTRSQNSIDVINHKGSLVRTALWWALEKRALRIAVDLLSLRNIDVDMCFDISPLMKAAEWGNESILKAILMRSRTLNYCDHRWHNALSYAARSGNAQAAALLIRAGVLDRVANVQGNTPLILAAQQGDPETVQVLASSAGYATVRHKNQRGLTALDEARAHGHQEAAKIIERF